MFVWDLKDRKKMTVSRSLFSHSGPIHDMKIVPNEHRIGLSSKEYSYERTKDEDNLTKFMTCSSDRTVRFWHHIDSTMAT